VTLVFNDAWDLANDIAYGSAFAALEVAGL
jgi:hypothetical protein